MKQFFTLISIMMGCLCSNAQVNLVPNPSFEDTIACPIGTGNINYAVSWNTFSETPDYLNSCNNSQAGVPLNNFGYQFAKTGSGFGGFYAFAQTAQYREIIGAQLIQPLDIGQKYYISFYISRAFNPGLYINIASNKLGIKFSTIEYSYLSPAPIDNFAQLFTDSLISDTLNWTRISNFFIADSAYRYICIGNFFNDSLTTRVRFDSLAAFSYYYIDDIRVSTDSDLVNKIEENNLIDPIKIFPNPARDWIAIEGRIGNKIFFYDLFGNLVFSDHLSSPLTRFNISDFKNGIYFLRVITPIKSVEVKIVIQ